jgi:4-hydroxybutyrate dehydrogenase
MAMLSYLTQIQFDHGAIKHLGKGMQRLNMHRPLIVTGPNLSKGQILQSLREQLPPDVPFVMFSDVPANPTEAAVLRALEVYRDAGCDSVICIGGGSPMDLGKAVALLARQPGPLAQYAAMEGGKGKIRDVAPLIAIPTTAGTDSEASVASVIICEDGRKLTFVSDLLLPRLAICDPQLTLGLPPGLTAATGMDAVTHCIEAVLSPVISPPAEAVGLDGLERAIAEGHLLRAVQDGQDADARWHMMMASTEGALAFIKGLGAVHAMSHAVGRIHELNLHHGTLNAVMLPAILRFNHAHVGDKYRRLNRALGLAANADIADFICDLNQRLGLPANLKEMGVCDVHLEGLADHAMADLNTMTNPRKPGTEDYQRLFMEVLG